MQCTGVVSFFSLAFGLCLLALFGAPPRSVPGEDGAWRSYLLSTRLISVTSSSHRYQMLTLSLKGCSLGFTGDSLLPANPHLSLKIDLESFWFHHTRVGMRWGKYVVVTPRLCIIDLKVHPGAPWQWNPFKTWGFGNHINHGWVAAPFKDMLGLLKGKFNC